MVSATSGMHGPDSPQRTRELRAWRLGHDHAAPIHDRLSATAPGHYSHQSNDHHHLPTGDGAGPDHHPTGDLVAPVAHQTTERSTPSVQWLDLDTHQQPLRRLPNHSEALGYGVTLPQPAYLLHKQVRKLNGREGASPCPSIAIRRLFSETASD